MTAIANTGAAGAHGLDSLAVELRREVEAAEADFRSALEHAVRAGELLLEAKAQVGHGEWLPWLEANFPGSVRSAQGYMRLAENAEDAQRVAHLGIKGALKQLAAPTSKDEATGRIKEPEWVVWEAEWLAHTGEQAPPRPAELQKWVRSGPVAGLLPPPEFSGEDLLELHANYVRECIAPETMLRTGGTCPPPPPSFVSSLKERNGSVRLQERERRTEREVGRILRRFDLIVGSTPKKMGGDTILRGGDWTVHPTGARRALKDLDAPEMGWSDADVENWARGYVCATLTPPRWEGLA